MLKGSEMPRRRLSRIVTLCVRACLGAAQMRACAELVSGAEVVCVCVVQSLCVCLVQSWCAVQSLCVPFRAGACARVCVCVQSLVCVCVREREYLVEERRCQKLPGCFIKLDSSSLSHLRPVPESQCGCKSSGVVISSGKTSSSPSWRQRRGREKGGPDTD